MAYLYALIAVSIVSLLSLFGALFLILKRRTFEALITYSLAISSGILLGSTFFDLIPESFREIGEHSYIWMIGGFITFFVIEKLINWHHCLEGDEHKVKSVAYLSLFGDGVHNFVDGAIVGVSFLTSVPLGITATMAIIAHEIPHELSDFSLLIYGGFSNGKALWYNFLSALTAVAGTLFVFIFVSFVKEVSPYMVGFAAGNFLYIAASDLIPELHHKHEIIQTILQTVCMVFGVVFMYVLTRAIAG